MTIPVSDTGGGDFKPVPQGTHAAICNMVIDLGGQQTTWQGQTKVKHQIYVRWEIPSQHIEVEENGQTVKKPMCIGKIYTASLSQKANLRKDLEGWRNKAFTVDELREFDLVRVLGTHCQIVVTHRESDGNTYANVTSVAGWPAGLDRPEPANELIQYSPDFATQHDKLPKWLQDKIANQIAADGSDVPGAAAPPAPPSPMDDFDDDIPF